MLWGSIGCGLCMVILTGLVHASDNGQKACGYAATVSYTRADLFAQQSVFRFTHEGIPNLQVFLFLFNTFFAFGWLGWSFEQSSVPARMRTSADSRGTATGSGWLYPSEISSLSVRAQANGLSTCANWVSDRGSRLNLHAPLADQCVFVPGQLGNFLVVEITPPAFAGIGAYTYLIFAVTNLFLIAPILYLFFPETARRSLEEIDLIFAEAYNAQQAQGGNRLVGHYVGHSLRRPHISGRELEAALQAQYALAKAKMPVDLKAYSIEHVEEASKRSEGEAV